MKLRELSKSQWDAALEASRVLMNCNPSREADRALFHGARQRLIETLPEGADERDLIKQAATWDSLNTFAAAFAGLPIETSPREREAGNRLPANQ